MEKSLIHFVVPFPAGYKAPVVAEPSVGAFDFPAMPVSPKGSSILKLYSFVSPRRSDKLNAPLLQPCSKCIRIVSFVAHQMFGRLPQLINRLFNECYLMWAGRSNEHSQRNTSAIRHRHELGALPSLRFPDFWVLFFCRNEGSVHENFGPINLALFIKPFDENMPNLLPNTLFFPQFQPSPASARARVFLG